MKNLNVLNYGFVELSAKELEDTNGGSLFTIVAETIGAAAGAIMDLANGISDGYQDGRIRRAIADSQSIA